MASWGTVYLIVAVVVGVVGVWNLARGRNPYLAIAGLLWFVAVLVRMAAPSLGGAVIVRGVPNLGDLLLYLAVPVFLVLALFSVGERR